MKNIFFTLALLISFSSFGQNDFCAIPKNLGDYYNISNHSKSLTNFGFRLPQGFDEYRNGRDNSVIKVFRKTDYSKRKDLSGNIVNNSITEFTITVMKWRELSRESPQYKMLLSMSNSKIKELMINNMIGRNKSIDPNEFVSVYETNGVFWIITGTWSEEKNLYLIMSVHYTNKQSIQLSFTTNIKGNTEEDVKRIKKLLDSFKYL